jgi:putative membrane protein
MAERRRLRHHQRSMGVQANVTERGSAAGTEGAGGAVALPRSLEVLRRPARAARVPRILHDLRWRLVAARLVVSLAAIALTIVIFPGMRILGTFWIWILVLGAVFGVLNAFVKPVLQVLMIRYLFVSYGLVVFAIYVALFWLLDVVTGKRLEIDGFWNLLGGGIVAGLLVILLENLIGVTAPVVDLDRRDAPAKER